MKDSGVSPPLRDARLRSALTPAASAEEIAALLDEVGRTHPARRRRLQAEGLHGGLEHLAQLAARCGWNGLTVLRHGQAYVEQDGVRLRAEPTHFRTAGEPRGATLAARLETFGVSPRVIVDLTPGSGEIALYLARRFPSAQVIAADPPASLMINLGWQDPALENFATAWIVPEAEAAWPADALQALRRSQALGRIDLLRFDAAAAAPGLAASIRALGRGLLAACVSFAGAAEDHLTLLAAFADAGLVLCEKGSNPVEDPAAWLRDAMSKKPAVTAWFVSRDQLRRQGRPLARAAAAVRRLARNPAGARAWVYELLDRRARQRDPTDKRFEFEKLYAESPDPWDYLTSGYEERKYRRTLETALRLRPRARAVLEIGCSIGVFTRVLSRCYPGVLAVDIANEALARARRHVGRRRNVAYLRRDVRRLDLGRNFDLIFCAETLYYLPEEAAPAVAAMLREALRPGGLLLTVFPCMPALPHADPGPRWKAWLTAAGLRLESEESFRDGRYANVIQAYARDQGPAADQAPRPRRAAPLP